MAGLNIHILIGNAGRDPDLRTVGDGISKSVFSVAVTERYGETENTTWHNVVCWRRLAEIVHQYVRRGGLVCVVGKSKTRKYEDSNGITKNITEIHADRVVFLSRSGEVTDSERHADDEPELGPPIDYDSED